MRLRTSCHNGLLLVIFTFALVRTSALAQAASTSMRSISGANVTVAVTPDTAVSAYAVEETIPEGVTPADYGNNGGTWDSANRKLKWGPFFDASPRTFTYTGTGTGVLAGTASFDGTGLTTTGDTQFGGQAVSTPTFTPDGGSYSGSSVSVTVSCSTASATIRYTTNGSEPTEASLTVASGGTVSAPVPGEESVTPNPVKMVSYRSGVYMF